MNTHSQDQRRAIEEIRRSLHGLRPFVLLVEDNVHDAKLIENELVTAGVRVVWARNQREAIHAFQEKMVRLVFLDLKLGVESGTTLIPCFKQIRPDAWIVVLSGAYTEDSAECKEALQLGAAAVMLKPMTQEKLQLIIGSP